VNLIAIQSQIASPKLLRSSPSCWIAVKRERSIHRNNTFDQYHSVSSLCDPDNYPMRTMETSVDEICSGDFAERVRINQSRLMAG
jgi:hypothetical protein